MTKPQNCGTSYCSCIECVKPPTKLCALCRLPRTMQGSTLIEIDGYKRWVHIHCATNSKESNK